MALPMDEQRILEEMERMLAADDPRLAARLAAFGQPGFGHVLRTRRARATLSLMALVLITAVAAVIYMMSAFRSGTANGPRLRPPYVAKIVSQTPPINAAWCAATYAPACAGLHTSILSGPSAQPSQLPGR